VLQLHERILCSHVLDFSKVMRTVLTCFESQIGVDRFQSKTDDNTLILD